MPLKQGSHCFFAMYPRKYEDRRAEGTGKRGWREGTRKDRGEAAHEGRKHGRWRSDWRPKLHPRFAHTIARLSPFSFSCPNPSKSNRWDSFWYTSWICIPKTNDKHISLQRTGNTKTLKAGLGCSRKNGHNTYGLCTYGLCTVSSSHANWCTE